MLIESWERCLVFWLLFLTVILWATYDIWAYHTGRQDFSASAVLRDWSREYPVIPFLAGLLAGHLWG
jgi:hypothetical protein